MRVIAFIICMWVTFNTTGNSCIPSNIDSLKYEEALTAIQHCKADSPFSFYAKSGDMNYAAGLNTKAIIAYENARLLNSNHTLVNQNLIRCYTNTDNPAKELIINDLNSKKHLFFNPKSANTWTVLSLLLWLVFMVYVLRTFKLKKPLLKAFLASGFIAFIFSLMAYYSLESAPIGIVIKDNSGCKEFSSETSENISVLNEGYKLEIIEAGLDWCKVQLATNKVCWIKTENIEVIDI